MPPLHAQVVSRGHKSCLAGSFPGRALIRSQQQTCDPTALHEVSIKDLVDIRRGLEPVPHTLRVDDECWPELATVEAARAVDPCRRKAELLGSDLHVVA